MTVGRLLSEASSMELARWRAYEKIEPFGDWRADVRAALIASEVRNTLRSKESDKVWSADDLMPTFDPVARQRKKDREIQAAIQKRKQ
jgi:hypothetical protein